MPRGGKRKGAGKPQSVAGTRAWLRKMCENPDMRAKVEAAVRASVEEGDLSDYWKALEHGFGRPPQALDIKVDDHRQSVDLADFWAGVEAADTTVTSTIPSSSTH